jgi:hypothetical protein
MASYLPPVVIDILGSDQSFLATLAKDKAALLAFAKTPTEATIGINAVPFETDLTTVKTQLLDFAQQLTNARLGADAAPFWADIATLRAEVNAMSPLDINVDAHTAAALAKIAALRASLADAQLGSLIGAAAGAGEEGGGGGGGSVGALLRGLLSAAGWGGGKGIGGFLGGMASFGSILSLMGFGAEHVAATGVGVAGSLAGAGLGAGFLGAGALGTAAVGMGTDMAGMGQAANDIKAVYQAQTQLNQAILQYGPLSYQAAAAQGNLNYTLSSFSPIAQAAVLQAARTAQGFVAMFDKLTGPAEKVGAQIINQAMQVGEAFLPTIGKYAVENMGIIQTQLQPFFSWLQNAGKGGGLGIFTQLEKVFQGELPTGMHALEQGFELFAKTVAIASPYLGKFVAWLNQFLTSMNGAHFGTWRKFVQDMIASFNDWFGLLVGAGKMVFTLFRPAVGLGDQIAKTLTKLFGQITSWLSGDHDLLHGLFSAHAAELIQGIGGIIAQALPFVEKFANAFMTFATGGAAAATFMLRGLADLLRLINRIPFATTILGWGAAFAYFGPKVLGGLSSMFRQIASFSFKNTVLGWARSLKEAATNIWQSLQTIWGSLGKVGAALGKVGGKIAEVAAKWGSAAANMVASGARWVAQLAMQTGKAIANFAIMVARKVAAAAVWIASNAAMAASATAAFIAENAATLGIIAGIAALVAGIVWVATHWKESWHFIVEAAKDAWHYIKAYGAIALMVLMPVVGAIVWVATHWGESWKAIKEATRAVIQFFETLPAKMLAIGKDIIHGLERGIKAAAGAVVRAAKSVAHDIWHGVKSFFGIFSPSTLMKQVGVNIMRGMTEGIRDNSHTANAVNAVGHVGNAILRYLYYRLNPAFHSAGIYLMEGLATGIEAASVQVEQAAVQAAEGALRATRAATQTHSPSRLYAKEGRNWMLGLVRGVQSTQGGTSQQLSTTVLAFFESLPAKMQVIGRDIISALQKGIKSQQQAAVSAAQGVATAVLAVFENLLAKMQVIGKDIIAQGALAGSQGGVSLGAAPTLGAPAAMPTLGLGAQKPGGIYIHTPITIHAPTGNANDISDTLKRMLQERDRNIAHIMKRTLEERERELVARLHSGRAVSL